ncbi:Hpt domain-containing response regulator [Kordiimonas aquimaris]|uniref:Hpt domain-containing response regulator n=1 Tax=Kordiimonas aquimaris TaxID=707591 RepID=UPI0021D03A32|nr:response regulator [Kordiimonas aquimaris]
MCKTGKRILIVEDTDSIALLLEANLRQQGYVPEVAGTVKQALECFKKAEAGPIPYDLLLLDVSLPDGNGLSLLEQLVSLENCPPIFVLSADGSSIAKENARLSGASMFFEKPFNFPRLNEAINQHIVHKKPERYAVCDVDIEAEKKALTKSYRDYLKNVAEQLQGGMSHKALTSLLHQLKGSAHLYGLNRLSELSTALGEQLINLGPKAAPEVKSVLRQEIIVDVDSNSIFAD